jgi:hypothetical protein
MASTYHVPRVELTTSSDRRTAGVVGGLFVVATVASLLGSFALGSTLDAPDYLVGVAGLEVRVVLAALLFLVAATSAVGTAFLLFPILRRYAEGSAAAYVGLRILENVFYVAGTVALLIMLTVSQEEPSAVAAADGLLGAALLALHEWTVVIGTLLFFSLGCLVLNVVLYRTRLVPRWLSLWGLVGAPLVFAYGLAGIAGADIGLGSPLMLLAMPLALQEMVFAVRLIAKGFDHPGTPVEGTPASAVETS